MRLYFRIFNRADLLLAGALLLAAGGILLAALLALADSRPGASVELRQEGRIIGVYPLYQDATLETEGQGLANRVIITDGAVYMESADCPDQYCVRHTPISSGGESIICLPARLTITIREGAEHELDAVAR